ncbi:MAG: glycine cleavage system aminomethyltransferase GcvT [Nitrospirae bacterium]|nr:glycine cleavage system aminomethyltransferase GcvT [Nitrospirota bacterium]
MKQTVLHQKHLQANAPLTEYQDWQTPLQFSDTLAEYHAVHNAAGLFDIGYLGRIEIAGLASTPFLQNMLTGNIAKITIGSVHYGLICNESGFILDDILILHLAVNRYLITTNAGNTDKILLWLKKHAIENVDITDRSQALAQFALQGPQAFPVLEKLSGPHLTKMKPKVVREAAIQGIDVTISRTGYTGDQGYELFVPADRAEALWGAIMAVGNEKGLLPCGFACRDILRMETGHLLQGKDLDETRTPLEAGLGSFVYFKKEFVGKAALLKLQAEGSKRKLAGFILLDKGMPKSGGSIFSESREIGVVTSGVQSPHRRAGIGLGYVVSRYAQAGQEIEIEVRDKEIAAKIVDLPFYRKKAGSASGP